MPGLPLVPGPESTTEEIRQTLADELVESGLGPDGEPNDRGRLIEVAVAQRRRPTVRVCGVNSEYRFGRQPLLRRGATEGRSKYGAARREGAVRRAPHNTEGAS